MNKRVKQFTAGAIATAIITSSLPMENLYAADIVAKIVTENNDEITYQSISEAISAMTDEDTLYLYEDCSDDIDIPSGQTWNIDATGYTYTGTIWIPSNSTLGLKGGNYVYPFDIDYFSNPNISISDGITCDYYAKEDFEKFISQDQVCDEVDTRVYEVKTVEEKAFRVNDTYYASPNRALNEVENGGTIYIVEDSSYDIKCDAYLKTVTLDAGNHIYSGNIDTLANINFASGTFSGDITLNSEGEYSFSNGCRFDEFYLRQLSCLLPTNQKFSKDEDGYIVVGSATDADKIVSVDGNTYLYVEQALDNSASDCAIQISGDYDLPIVISSGKNVKLEMGNNKLKNYMEVYSTLEIASGTFDSADAENPYYIATSQPLTITGGYFGNVDFYIFDFGNPDYEIKGGTYTPYAYNQISDCVAEGYESIYKNGKYTVQKKQVVLKTGWQFIEGKWYYYNSNGNKTTGWQYVGGKWYYMNSGGAMTTGWQYIGGRWYLMNSSGVWIR